MRPLDLRAVFDYPIETRRCFLETFRELGCTPFAQGSGASRDSWSGISLHILDDEEAWPQIATQGRTLSEAPGRNANDYVTFAQTSREDARVGALMRSRLRELSDTDLEARVNFPWPGEAARSFGSNAMAAAIDDLAPLGQMVALLWRRETPPPFLG